MNSRFTASVASLVILLAAQHASAQPAGPTPAIEPSSEAEKEARTRFLRGVQLYDDGDFQLALIEFQRVYATVPNYKILYNIGQVQQQLGHYALALRALRKYLDEGGTRIASERRKQVEDDIERLRARTALVSVKTSVPDAEIMFDGETLARGSVEGTLVDAGVHRLRVAKRGFKADERSITLAGGDVQSFNVVLEKEPDTTRIISAPTRPTSSEAYIAWSVTGALAVGAGVFGGLALSKANELDQQRNTVGSTTQERDSTKSTAQTFMITADALGAATLIAGGIALYFTIRKPKSLPANTAQFRLSPSMAYGTFVF